MQTLNLSISNRNTKFLKRARIKKNQLGFNALELMMVLAVIAIAVVAMVRVMGSNSDKTNAHNMVSDISSLVQNIRSAYGSSNNGYTTLNNQSAIDMKLVPGDLPINGSTIKNQFQGGTVTIAAGANNDNFIITYTNVPASVCNIVVTTLGGASFSNITINSAIVYDTTSQVVLDPAAVGSACSANKDQASILFTAS